MSFKHRVGNFLILFGLIGLLIFAASVLAPPADSFDIPAFLVGAVLLVLGLNFRLSKSASGPPAGERAAAAKSAPAKSAGPKSGPPAGGGGKPGGPKKQGLVNTIMKGPNDKRLTGGGKPQGAPKKK